MSIEDDVGVVALREHLARTSRPSLPAPTIVTFLRSLTYASSFSMIASAYSLVPTAVGSSRDGFMS